MVKENIELQIIHNPKLTTEDTGFYITIFIDGVDKNGYVKVYLNDIWKDLPEYITRANCNIDVELVESQDDGKVYKLIF